MDEVAATGAVEIVDFKGHYGMEMGELPALLAMYERAIAAFPDRHTEGAGGGHAPDIITVAAGPTCCPPRPIRPGHTPSTRSTSISTC